MATLANMACPCELLALRAASESVFVRFKRNSRFARVKFRTLLTYGEAPKIFALRADRTQARSVDSKTLVTLAFLGASA